MDAIVIYCTVPDKRAAKEISKYIIKHHLAACVSAVDRIESVFSWDGETEKEKEILLMIKTIRTNFEKIKVLITELHPYNVPEIIAVPIVDCSKEYLQWLVHETRQ
ncbi:MAG: divalent-cation tolerance protein CutA [Candidatus Gastranaerophilales bacterium]|nr:divalent-cation tolerance protein CutA [Candidatus Gastranaerophilales bacterium]